MPRKPLTKQLFDQIKSTLDINKQSNSPATKEQIAKIFGVSGTTVGRIERCDNYSDYEQYRKEMNRKYAQKYSPKTQEQSNQSSDKKSSAPTVDTDAIKELTSAVHLLNENLAKASRKFDENTKANEQTTIALYSLRKVYSGDDDKRGLFKSFRVKE